MADAFNDWLLKPKSRKVVRASEVFREMPLRQGVPDFVITFGRKLNARDAEFFKKLKSLDIGITIKVAKTLNKNSPRSIRWILKKSGLSREVVIRSWIALKRLKLVSETPNETYFLSSHWREPKAEVWAFELKLANWKRALYQSCQSLAFADRSIVVFPMDRELLINANIERFKRMGIGVLLFDAESLTHKVLNNPSRSRSLDSIHTFSALLRHRERSNTTAFILQSKSSA